MMKKITNLGGFREKGIIQYKTSVSSTTTNEPIETWQNYTGSIRYRKERQSGRENFEAGRQETAVGTVVLTTHRINGVDEKMRMKSSYETDSSGNNVLYYFKDVFLSDDRKFLRITAENRV